MKRLALILLTVVVLAAGSSGMCAAEEVPANSNRDQETRAVEQVDRTLSNRRRFPWYDTENGTLRFIPPRIPKNATRATKESTPKDDNNIRSIISTLILWGTVLILAVVGLLLVWAIVSAWRLRTKTRQDRQSDQTRRLETLLPEVRQHVDSLLAAVQEALEAGRYQEALVFYFSFLLVELDKPQLIVLEKGKTNHDYARELKNVPTVLPFYLRAMNLFERCYYGNCPLDRDDFMPIWNERELFLDKLQNRDQTPDMAKTLWVPSPENQNVQPPVANDLPPVVNDLPPVDSVQSTTDNQSNQPHSSGGNMINVLLPALILLSSCLGCSRYWDETYVNYVPVYSYDRSINGDTVFRTMCKDVGHSCSMPLLKRENFDRYDCIVWYYHSFLPRQALETMEVADVVWIRQWMKAKPGRSLIIVNQGYIADVDFWDEMLSVAPDKHRMWCRQKRNEAIDREFMYCLSSEELAMRFAKQLGIDPETKNASDGQAPPSETQAPQEANDSLTKANELLSRFFKFNSEETAKGLWFQIENMMNVKSATTLTGLSYWTDGLPDGPPLRMTKRLIPEGDTQTELYADGMPLICCRKVQLGNVYIVQSGSFLLNYPLTSERNRILASRLINRLGPKKKIIFVQGTSFVPQTQQQEEDAYRVPPFALSRLSAFSLLFWHLFFLGLVIFFWKFPIFGRPKKIPPVENVDFGRHLEAYGKLLERTGNTDWARDQIDKWTREQSVSKTGDQGEMPPPGT